MLKFLREHDVPTEVKKMRKNGKLRIAVPFWGEGAIAALGLMKGDDVEIVCNIESRACNPYVVEDLLKNKFKIRTHKRLHAKLYISTGRVIVGSSNASTNGLLDEASETKGWVEANILTDDPGILHDAHKLFGDLWRPKNSKSLTLKSTLLKLAKDAWDNKPPPPPPIGSPNKTPGKTLLAACRKYPGAFKDVYLAVYDKYFSEKAKKVEAIVKSEISNAIGYQFPIPPGSWVIDFYVGAEGPRIWATAYAPISPAKKHKVKGEEDMVVTLGGQIKLPGFSQKLKFGRGEKEFLVKNAPIIRRLAKTKTLVSLPLALKEIDQQIKTRRAR